MKRTVTIELTHAEIHFIGTAIAPEQSEEHHAELEKLGQLYFAILGDEGCEALIAKLAVAHEEIKTLEKTDGHFNPKLN